MLRSRRLRCLAPPSSAQFMSNRTCRSSSRRTQGGTYMTGSARVTTSGWVKRLKRLMSPQESLLSLQTILGTGRPNYAPTRPASLPPSLPLAQAKRLPPVLQQNLSPVSKRSTPEHRPALHGPCPSRQTLPCRVAAVLCCGGPCCAAPCRAPECTAAGWEPPCATVAAARALHHALPCLPCAGR